MLNRLLALLRTTAAEGIQDAGDQKVVVEEGSSKAVDSDAHEIDNSKVLHNIQLCICLSSPLL